MLKMLGGLMPLARGPRRGSRLSRFLASPVPTTREWWHHAVELVGDDLAASIAEIQNSPWLQVLPSSFLLGTSIADFAAEFKSGISEVIHWPLESYSVYATGGQTQLQLFGVAAGSTSGSGYGDTNMQQAGMMAGNEAHVVMSFRIHHIPSVADSFVSAALAPAFRETYQVLVAGLATSAVNAGCWAEFRIGDKLYLQAGPLALFPPGFGIGGGVFSSTAVAATQSGSVPQSGHPSNMAIYKMDPPTLILPSRTFNVTLNWKGAVPVTNAGGSITRTGCILDGYRIRAIQ